MYLAKLNQCMYCLDPKGCMHLCLETHQYITVLLSTRKAPLLGNEDERHFSGLNLNVFLIRKDKALSEDSEQHRPGYIDTCFMGF